MLYLHPTDPPVSPDYSISVEVRRNHTSGLANVAGTLRLSAHWEMCADSSGLIMYIKKPDVPFSLRVRFHGTLQVGMCVVCSAQPHTHTHTHTQIL